MVADYQSAKIYKIVSAFTHKVYVGSTTMTLRGRFRSHKSAHKNVNTRITSSLILRHPDAHIVLIEDYPCDSRSELCRREGYYVELLDSVNRRTPGRTSVEYNKHRWATKQDEIRLYRERHKEELQQYMRNRYREKRTQLLARASQRIQCICGSILSRSSISAHYKSLNHTRWVLNQHNHLNHLKLP